MIKKKSVKIVCITLVIITIFSICTVIFDYIRINNFKKPIFTVSMTADDGGSGVYCGLGYSMDIGGELIDGSFRINDYEYSILGIEVSSIVRA